MRVLVLGATGMLGSTLFRYLYNIQPSSTWATMRGAQTPTAFTLAESGNIIPRVAASDIDLITGLIRDLRIETVVNCIGVIKQLAEAADPLIAIPLNSMLPHQLQKVCERLAARLIHISTDCVFDGKRGQYSETDLPDASDLYGRSKALGEVVNADNAVTLRTSIIGHELNSNLSLVDWFLTQQYDIKGYRRAVFSGLPTVELAAVIHERVFPAPISGLFHVAAQPIDKYTLLNIIARVYGKHIKIIPDDSVVVNRSLMADKFLNATGYQAPDWETLVEKMYRGRILGEKYV